MSSGRYIGVAGVGPGGGVEADPRPKFSVTSVGVILNPALNQWGVNLPTPLANQTLVTPMLGSGVVVDITL